MALPLPTSPPTPTARSQDAPSSTAPSPTAPSPGAPSPSAPSPGAPSPSAPVRSALRFVVEKAVLGSLGVVATLGVYRFLGAEDTGRLTLAMVVAANVGLASVGGMNELLARFGPRVGAASMGGLLRSCLRVHAALIVGLVALSVAAVALGLPVPAELRSMAVPLALMLVGHGLVTLLFGGLRGAGRYRVIPKIDGTRNLVAKLAALGVLVAGFRSFEAVFGVYVAFQFVAAAFAVWMLRDLLRAGPAVPLERTHMSFAGWSFTSAVLMSVIVALDPIVVRGFHDAAAVGLVGAGMRIPRLAHQLILSPVQIPVLYYINRDDFASRRAVVFREGMRAATAVLAVVASILFAFADMLPRLIGGDFAGVETVLRLSLGWLVLMGILGFCPTYFFTAGTPRHNVGILLGQLALQGMLAFVLVPTWGAPGAAAAAVGGALGALVLFGAVLFVQGEGRSLVRPVLSVAAVAVACTAGFAVHPALTPVVVAAALVGLGEITPARVRAGMAAARRRGGPAEEATEAG